VLERYEHEAAGWARRHRGSVVELHCYATSSEASGEAAIAQLHRLYPETAEAGVVHRRLLRRSDCPLFAPGTYSRRPTVATPQPGLVLAGDGIRIDLPVALMERAATTGWSAANQLLTSFRPAAGRRCCGHWPRPKGGAGNESAPALAEGRTRWDDSPCLVGTTTPDLPRRAAGHHRRGVAAL
jgi:hypothetical protein